MLKRLEKLTNQYIDTSDLGLDVVFDSTESGKKLACIAQILIGASALIVCFPFFWVGLYCRYRWPRSYKGRR